MRPNKFYGRDSEFYSEHEQDTAIVLLEDQMQRELSHSDAGIILYDPVDSNQSTPVCEAIVQPHEKYPMKGIDEQESNASTHQSPTFRDRADTETTGSSAAGAIRPGGPIQLFTRQHFGLWYMNFNIGFIVGMSHSIGYPVFFMYFHLEPYQQQAATALIKFSWSLRFIIGFLCDCYPIRRQRRRPYMMIGTVLQCIVGVGCMLLPTTEPFFKNGMIHNPNASHESMQFVIASTIAGITAMIMSTAADGLMVDYSLRESGNERGNLYLQLQTAYFGGSIVSTLLVALGCNSDQYGGTFSFSIGPSGLFGILAIPGFLSIYMLYHCLEEVPVKSGSQPLYTHMRAIYRLVERKATWSYAIFILLHGFCYSIIVPTEDVVYFFWLKGDSLSRAFFSSISHGLVFVTLILYRTDRFRNLSWRTVIASMTVLSVIVGFITMFVTIFDINRQKYLFMMNTSIMDFTSYFVDLVRLIVAIEIAEPRYEATTFALMSCLFVLSDTWGACISNAISSGLGLSAEALLFDTQAVRLTVMKDYIIMYSIRLVMGLGLLFLLPSQKREMRKLIKQGSPSLVIPMIFALVFAIIFFLTWISHFLSMFKSTACLKFAGGPGCKVV